MTNNQTSLKLNKLQEKQISSITKENGLYILATEINWALDGQSQTKEFKTLKEVKQAIKNIIPFLTINENDNFKRNQTIKSLTDDYKWAKRNNDYEVMKVIKKELKNLGIII